MLDTESSPSLFTHYDMVDKTWVAMEDIKHMLVFIFSLKCRGASFEDYILPELNWFLNSFCYFKVLQRYVVSNALTILELVAATQTTCPSKPLFRHLDDGQNFEILLLTFAPSNLFS